ncbi:hypothetical protein ACIP98_40580, partial [Streptomyces sp. NPDC088354]
MEPDFPWDRAPYPVLVADAAGTLLQRNGAAQVLLPAARPGRRLADVVPAWLAAAHQAMRPAGRRAAQEPGAPASGPLQARRFEAYPSVRDDGTVAWWLVDDTDHQLARDALRTERERTAFLVKASTILLSSLNLGRCMDVTAQLAAENLADAALAIAPARGQRLPVVTCLRGGAPTTSQEAVDPDDVPGLGEALRGFPPVPSRWIDPSVAPQWMIPEGFGPIGALGRVSEVPGDAPPIWRFARQWHPWAVFSSDHAGAVFFDVDGT